VSSSYYDDVDDLDWVDVVEEEPEQREVPCPAHCRNGLVEVHGQETDCITCEGFGTILV
jgi:hypothetical protein